MIKRGKTFWVPNPYDVIKLDVKNPTVVVTGDWHCGKYNGHYLGGTPNDQIIVPQTDLQKKQAEQLEKHLKEMDPIDVLAILGDLTEGKQVRVAGIGLNDTNTDIQVDMAFKTFSRMIEALQPKHILSVEGTAYHSTLAIGGSLDYQVTRRIADAFETPIYYGLELNTKMDKLLWNFKHAFPPSRNPASIMEKIIKEFATTAILRRKSETFPNVFCRAHIHRLLNGIPLGYGEDGASTIGFVAPSLCMKDDYTLKKPYEMNPDMGLLKICQWNKRVWGVPYPIFLD